MRQLRHGLALLVLFSWALLVGASLLERFLRAPGADSEQSPDARTAALEQRLLLLEEENLALRRLLDLGGKHDAVSLAGFDPLPAFLSAPCDLSPRRRSAILDAGSEQGVRPGQGVISGAGLVGRIASVDEHHARVLLLDDPEFRVHYTTAAGTAGSEGIAGGGPLPGRLTAVIHRDLLPLARGSVLITAGDDGVFPRGIRVGVTPASEEGTGSGEADIHSAADVSAGVEVLVLRTRSEVGGK